MDGNSAAYPFAYNYVKGMVFSDGLTKREWIAAMALQGLLSNKNQEGYWGDFAERAVKATDALIAELSKEVASE